MQERGTLTPGTSENRLQNSVCRRLLRAHGPAVPTVLGAVDTFPQCLIQYEI